MNLEVEIPAAQLYTTHCPFKEKFSCAISLSITRIVGEGIRAVQFLNQIFYKDAAHMSELPDSSVQLVITSPPYFSIKDYSKNGYQDIQHSEKETQDAGGFNSFSLYINKLLEVWKECERILKPNGKLCINVPLMPMLKKDMNTHYNRDIFDLKSHIEISILNQTGLHLLDIYIWNRTNPSKKLMFGSYPYPRNFYAQNTCEFILVFVKDGIPENNLPEEIKKASVLTKDEWVEFTKQIWNIPIPGRGDLAFGVHSAIMPEEIARRLIRLYSFQGELILDPFTGSGTTLKVAKELKRHYVGYELYEHYKKIIDEKLGSVSCLF